MRLINFLAYLAGIVLVALVARVALVPRSMPQDPACHGGRLDIAGREQAQADGYEIDRERGCITRASYDRVQSELARWSQARAQAETERVQAEHALRHPGRTLAQARDRFVTGVAVHADATPLPRPPGNLFMRSDYASGKSSRPGFATPDPGDGRRRPAIVWLTGGDSSTLDDFWSPPADDENDQTAHAFRDAGIVMYFPTLRGGNDDTAGHEYFLGEVDDVLAAADHVASLPWVDPKQVYLGGHSTGGTLALLAAETSGRFAGVFAFGPVASVQDYPASIVPLPAGLPEEEFALRSPIHWLEGLSSPTYLIEGEQQPGNITSLHELCRGDPSPWLHCIPVAGRTHFSVLAPSTRTIAARIAMAGEGIAFSLGAADLARR